MYATIEIPEDQSIDKIAKIILAKFPTKGKIITVNSSDDVVIYLNIYGKFDQEQVDWLENNSLIANLTFGMGGFIDMPPHSIATIKLSFPCEWELKYKDKIVKLIIASNSKNYLFVDGIAKHFTTHDSLYAKLKAFDIPMDGWIQHIQLCERCDAPGASSDYPRCIQCEQEYHSFMNVPMKIWEQS
jgi:hypothetical protein